jgi:lysophospholipid acyltransferase (LPLAT)-like uncharacterized protein
MLATHAIIHFTCRKEIIYEVPIDPKASFIYCGWHEAVIPYMMAFNQLDRPMVQITNNAWFMWPIHLFVRRMGMIHLIPFKVGEMGKEALLQVIELLNQGFSTVITPDGPAGPAKNMKNGVMIMAQRSGVPILPVRSEARVAWVWSWTWDRKRIPLPFSRIRIYYGKPIHVTAENADEMEKELIEAMGLDNLPGSKKNQ